MWDSAKASLDDFLKTFGEVYKDILLVESTDTSGTGYASGTSHATPGIHELFEKGDEYIFEASNGRRYKMFSGGEKVLNAKATDFLYKFANNGQEFLSKIIETFAGNFTPANITKNTLPVQLSTGDIIIQGNASDRTVSEIRRAQRENIDYVLREFRKLNK